MTAPKLAVTQPDGTRKYVNPATGETEPSVTTIIKGGIPQPWMGPWAAKMAAEHACANWTRLSGMPPGQRIAEMKNAHVAVAAKAANLGDIVHSLAECWMTGVPFPDCPKEAWPFTNSFIDFLHAEHPEFLENECTMWSRIHGYAGTADFIIRIRDKVYLSDLKTGKSLHEEVGLQLSALANADFILRADGTEDEIPPLDGLAALHVRPRSWKLVEVREEQECFQAFLAARRVMDWSRNVAPRVLGK